MIKIDNMILVSKDTSRLAELPSVEYLIFESHYSCNNCSNTQTLFIF